jgi:transcriptional regulator with XRE-family HTH domain
VVRNGRSPTRRRPRFDGAKFKAARESAGFTLAALATIIGVDVRSLSSWETSPTANPSGSSLTAACRAFNEQRSDAGAPEIRADDFWRFR